MGSKRCNGCDVNKRLVATDYSLCAACMAEIIHEYAGHFTETEQAAEAFRNLRTVVKHGRSVSITDTVQRGVVIEDMFRGNDGMLICDTLSDGGTLEKGLAEAAERCLVRSQWGPRAAERRRT